jgi:hypothetical protein
MRPKPAEPLPYLKLAFQLAVDLKQWPDAEGLLEELFRRDQKFYGDADTLLSVVKAFCHKQLFVDAEVAIDNVDKHVSLDQEGRARLQLSRDELERCRAENL